MPPMVVLKSLHAFALGQHRSPGIHLHIALESAESVVGLDTRRPAITIAKRGLENMIAPEVLNETGVLCTYSCHAKGLLFIYLIDLVSSFSFLTGISCHLRDVSKATPVSLLRHTLALDLAQYRFRPNPLVRAQPCGRSIKVLV